MLNPLLKQSRKLVESTLIKYLTSDCVTCDFSKCAQFDCCFRNRSFASLFNFPSKIRKHWIYYFMYSPNRNWSFPRNSIKYHIHHLDEDHFNDSERNLIMLYCNDHTKLHAKWFKGITKNENYHVFYI